ncbi:hypothetical protein HUB98_10080 [Paenibacillus barcinonensis]|uniref:Uncharacterized protein n=1 Tax=Paenibacillus barcinonensis TaxID=198119 RepID=A0A2V4VA04_PAEBA|nr:hypothetical protein [Paenibacillus barcinonensis]PYE49641.1 hypothetical protein DFQ00_105145 [Paenibacillus barcinonensis]QKS54849.1 hypothetical protein HUB98_10080 [Paenibacillus barcinonensis]
MIFAMIICVLVILILGQYVVKTAIDTSKNSQHTREILEELREIKAFLREKK